MVAPPVLPEQAARATTRPPRATVVTIRRRPDGRVVIIRSSGKFKAAPGRPVRPAADVWGGNGVHPSRPSSREAGRMAVSRRPRTGAWRGAEYPKDIRRAT